MNILTEICWLGYQFSNGALYRRIYYVNLKSLSAVAVRSKNKNDLVTVKLLELKGYRTDPAI